MGFIKFDFNRIVKELSTYKIRLESSNHDGTIIPKSILYINEHETGLYENQEPWILLRKVNLEITKNLSSTNDKQKKKSYLEELHHTFNSLESKIVQGEYFWTISDLIYEGCTENDFEARHWEELSGFLNRIKVDLQRKILFLENEIKKCLSEEELMIAQKISNGNSALDDINQSCKNFKKIKFKDDLNILVTLFFDLYRKNYITTTTINLEKFICDSFLDKNGESISTSSVNTILKPAREEKRAKNDKRIIIPDRT
jgi:hypothetical protein